MFSPLTRRLKGWSTFFAGAILFFWLPGFLRYELRPHYMSDWKKYLNRFFLGCGLLLLISLILFHIIRPPGGSEKELISPPGVELPPSTLTLSDSPVESEKNSVRNSFSLGEKIYALLAIQKPLPGKHKISFHWLNPTGGLQERFDKHLADSRPGYRCWSWIKLSGEEFLPLAIGPFSTKKFFGQWRVETYLDGNFLTAAEFMVE